MATDLIRYDLLVQDALRAVMRKVLVDAAREGLPGDHHFFITFRTHAPGVRLSSRMREKYPNEMGIVLQHQFWDLVVGEQAFEVGLSFNDKSETVVIPFDAVTGFFDPSVEFGLKFEMGSEAANDHPVARPSEAVAPPARPALTPAPAPTLAHRAPSADKAKPRGSGSEPEVMTVPQDQTAVKSPKTPAVKTPTAKAPAATNADKAKVVSIDSFRKKP